MTAATTRAEELLALREIASFNITPDTGASVAMRMRDIACNAINAATARLAAKPADEGFPMSPSSLMAAWSRYVALFGEPPHGTEEQIRALLRLVPSTTGEPKR